MDILFAICLFVILTTTSFTTVMIYRWTNQPEEVKPEPTEDEKLDSAVELIRDYCKTRSNKCRFNTSKSKKECDCMLLKQPPEWWGHEDNKN